MIMTDTKYALLLQSIISRASDAIAHQGEGEIGEMVTAINDVEGDLNTLLARINKDDVIIAALEAEGA
jgi:hypothetical protein